MDDNNRKHFFLVAFLAFAAFLIAALAKHHSLDWPFQKDASFKDVRNLAGPFGSLLAWLCIKTMGGFFAWFIPAVLIVMGTAAGSGKVKRATRETAEMLLVIFLLNTFFALNSFTMSSELLSGWVGRGVAGGLSTVFGKVGSTILITALLLIVLLSRIRSLGRVTAGLFKGKSISLGWFVSIFIFTVKALRASLRYMISLLLSVPGRLTAKRAVSPGDRDLVNESVFAEASDETGGIFLPAGKIAKEMEEKEARTRPSQKTSSADADKRNAPPPLKESEKEKPPLEEAALPPVSLLDAGGTDMEAYPPQKLRDWANVLEAKLANYNIEGKVTAIKHGPLITTFEFEPSPGVKIKDIVSRSDDISLAMRAKSLRLIAPIPGRSVVGIEIPNPKGAMVYLRSILEKIPERLRLSGIMVGIGVDVMGEPFYMNLCNAPHLLVAGTTGSGKSVALHAILSSILLQYRPADVRLLIIDPKMMEMNVYNGIPHLLHPVTSEPREAVRVFQYLIAEMERRKELLKDSGVKNIESFNSKLSITSSGESAEKLPYIVLAIDELGDLVLSKGADMENLLSKLSNMARAVGIHMVVATQRPSVDVIVGKTKANFPTRIAFRVASKVDSRTILDTVGAEKLIGRGDMLYTDSKNIKPIRLHGAFITEAEVERIVSHWKSYDYPASYLQFPKERRTGDVWQEEEDPLYEESKSIVLQYRQGSTSLLQRKLHIGYARAARLLDRLEQDGVVGPPDGSKPREVLVPESPGTTLEE